MYLYQPDSTHRSVLEGSDPFRGPIVLGSYGKLSILFAVMLVKVVSAMMGQLQHSEVSVVFHIHAVEATSAKTVTSQPGMVGFTYHI